MEKINVVLLLEEKINLSSSIELAEKILKAQGINIEFYHYEEDDKIKKLKAVVNRRHPDKPPYAFLNELLYEYFRNFTEGTFLIITDSEVYTQSIPPIQIKGVSIPSYGISVVSISYLKDKKDNGLYHSLTNTILHEIGHLYGLKDHYIKIKPQKIFENFKITSDCVMDKIKIAGGLRDWLEFYISKFLFLILSKTKIYRSKNDSLSYFKKINQLEEEFIKIRPFYYCRECIRNFRKVERMKVDEFHDLLSQLLLF
jgi:predicted Zn-dependent protease